MSSLKNLIRLLFVIFLISSCKGPNVIQNSDDNLLKNETKEIRISCGDGSIDELLKEGWVIKKEYSEEKVCSWKTERANKKCNLEKDKGCKIIKPDEIGLETIYLLEKSY